MSRFPSMLNRLLHELQDQKTNGSFSYSIVVVDNDSKMSAKKIVQEFSEKSPLNVLYFLEPEQNIAKARNKALANASGEYVALIDDDELPGSYWLLSLFEACNEHPVDGVLGPVKVHFEEEPERWIVNGKFYERPSHENGHVMHWDETRTGNVLMRIRILGTQKEFFNPQFKYQGEDKDFFRRMIAKGHVFIWNNESAVYETVPKERLSLKYLIKRAFIQGNISSKYYNESKIWTKSAIVLKTVIASLVYSLILPITSLFGKHILVRILIKDIHHISRLLAFSKIYMVKGRNI